MHYACQRVLSWRLQVINISPGPRDYLPSDTLSVDRGVEMLSKGCLQLHSVDNHSEAWVSHTRGAGQVNGLCNSRLITSGIKEHIVVRIGSSFHQLWKDPSLRLAAGWCGGSSVGRQCVSWPRHARCQRLCSRWFRWAAPRVGNEQ